MATPSLDDLNAAFDDHLLFDDSTAINATTGRSASGHNEHDDDDGLQEADDGHASLEWSPETELYLRQMPLEQIFCISDDRDDDDEEYGSGRGVGGDEVVLGAIDYRNKMRGVVLTGGAGGGRVSGNQCVAGDAEQRKCNAADVNSRRVRTAAFLQRMFGGKSLDDVRVSFSDMTKSLLTKRSGGLGRSGLFIWSSGRTSVQLG